MPSTPILGVTYPSENKDPYWTTEQATWLAIDSWLGAAREDGMLIVTGGGEPEVSGGNVVWDEDLSIYNPTLGTRIVISAGLVACADGQVLYVTVPSRPYADQTLAMSAANYVSTSLDIVVGMRVGDHVYLRNRPLPFVIESTFLPIADALDGFTAAPAATAAHSINWGKVNVRHFDSAAVEDVVWTWALPVGFWGAWATHPIQYAVDLVITSAVAPAAGEGVRWGSALRGYVTSDTLNQGAVSYGGVSNADMSAYSQHERVLMSWTDCPMDGTPAPGALANVYLQRDPTHVDDDYLQDVGVAGLWLRYPRRLKTDF